MQGVNIIIIIIIIIIVVFDHWLGMKHDCILSSEQ